MEPDGPVWKKSGHKIYVRELASHNGNHATIELSVIYIFLFEYSILFYLRRKVLRSVW